MKESIGQRLGVRHASAETAGAFFLSDFLIFTFGSKTFLQVSPYGHTSKLLKKILPHGARNISSVKGVRI